VRVELEPQETTGERREMPGRWRRRKIGGKKGGGNVPSNRGRRRSSVREKGTGPRALERGRLLKSRSPTKKKEAVERESDMEVERNPKGASRKDSTSRT